MPIADFNRLITARWFPGLPEKEFQVARRWLSDNRDNYDRVTFNARLGPGHDAPEHYDPAVREAIRANSQKRVDIAAWRGEQPFIIELKDRIGFAVLGQLLGYQALWMKDDPASLQPKLIAAGWTIMTDCQEVFESFGIAVELLGALS